jgi:phage-related protein
VAQFGGKHPSAKPWRGEGPGVFEVVEDYRGDSYRTVYTVRFERAIYVLHAFQKKSPSGIRTGKKDVELIGRRISEAKADCANLVFNRVGERQQFLFAGANPK